MATVANLQAHDMERVNNHGTGQALPPGGLAHKSRPSTAAPQKICRGLSRSPHRTWGKVVGCTYSYLATIAQVLNGRHKGAEAQPHAPVLKLVIHKQLWDAQLL